MGTNEIQQTAQNLRHAWQGTDPMHSAYEVSLAVAASEIPADEIADLVEALCPLLREDGLLVPRPWREVSLWPIDGGESIKGDSAQGREALGEFRTTGSTAGFWMVDPAECSDEENLPYAGPTVSEIDWTGFAD